MNDRTLFRILFTLGAVLCVLYMPWVVVLLFLIVGFFLFDFYIEGIVLAILMDILYVLPTIDGLTIVYFTPVAVVVYLVMSRMKTQFRF